LRRGSLTQHPWRAFLVSLALQGTCSTLIGFVLFGILRLPRQPANIEASSTATLLNASAPLGYGITPFLLDPVGKFFADRWLPGDPARETTWRTEVPSYSAPWH
jgi:hypothetical protein